VSTGEVESVVAAGAFELAAFVIGVDATAEPTGEDTNTLEIDTGPYLGRCRPFWPYLVTAIRFKR
jgi:hypothetical protein